MTDTELYRAGYLNVLNKLSSISGARDYWANRYADSQKSLQSAKKKIKKLESEKAELIAKYHLLEGILSKIHEQAVLKADLLKIFDEDSQPE